MSHHILRPNATPVHTMQQYEHLHAAPTLARTFQSRLRKVIIPDSNKKSGHDVGVPWFPPREECAKSVRSYPQCHVEDPGSGFRHPVTMCEVLERMMQLPREITGRIEERLDHLSMPHLRSPSLPAYGMQWGSSVYLLPIETDRIEQFPALPPVTYRQELAKYGAQWIWNENDKLWECRWTEEALRIFYLENVLIHEIGHLLDTRNNSTRDREAFANAFAAQYGNPPKRFNGKKPPHAQRKNMRHG